MTMAAVVGTVAPVATAVAGPVLDRVRATGTLRVCIWPDYYGITYRNHFDSANDPAKFGLFYHAALLLRRGDLQPAQKTAGVRFPADPQEWLLKRPGEVPALKGLPEQHKTVLLLNGAQQPVDLLQPWDQPLVDENQDQVNADNGQMGRNWRERWGWIDTPRTKAAYGFLNSPPPK